jgi:hypothetical protein
MRGSDPLPDFRPAPPGRLRLAPSGAGSRPGALARGKNQLPTPFETTSAGDARRRKAEQQRMLAYPVLCMAAATPLMLTKIAARTSSASSPVPPCPPPGSVRKR